MPSSHLILCRPLLLLPPIPPNIRVFSNESTLCMRWAKYWSFSFSISPSNEHPGLITFRMDWLDLLAVQGTLKSLLHHNSSKASILWCSAFFSLEGGHPQYCVCSFQNESSCSVAWRKIRVLSPCQRSGAKARSGSGPQINEGFIPVEDLNSRHGIRGSHLNLEPKPLRR